MKQKEIDILVNDLIFTDDIKKKQDCLAKIWEIAKSKRIILSSIHDLYRARGRDEIGGFTVPAINLRGLTLHLARAIFRTSLRNDAGAFIFEIAKSEMGYTNQRPVEYTGVVLAAAIKEGFVGPVFIQGDHFQINAKKFTDDPKKEINSIKELIEESVSAGFYNIDIDSSTVVDLEKPEIKEQQRQNFETCAQLTKFIRKIEPEGITISVGGEIGEVGGKNSTLEDLRFFMEGYKESLPADMQGISKISIQTGTSHGGVVLPNGSIANVKLDFDTLKNLSEVAKREYGLAGCVQHGASTLPSEAFHKFPEVETAEVHLATEFQNMIYENKYFPPELKERIYFWLNKNCSDEREDEQTEEQFIYKTRKKALGPFKKEIMSLPEELRENIGHDIEAKFDFLFKQLKVINAKDIVKKYIKPVETKLLIRKGQKAKIDSEGAD
ncbi:MAG: class II fructose-bisphosphate aldolase [Candidatus Omnitrophota bacterium]|nr:class II fructose-bisphosphate aldolase [Candidatus Omnitrophota bacterium]